MNPYYSESSGKLYLGDCLEIMPQIPDKSIDCIICDLPYGTTSCSWDTVIPFEPLWEQYKRIIKDNGAIVLFGSQPFTTDLINSNRKWFRYEWIWEKTMCSNFILGNKQPMKYHENICVFYKNQPCFNKQMQERSLVGKERLKNNGSILKGTKKSNHISTNIDNNGQRDFYDKNLINPKSILKFGSVPNCNNTKLHPNEKPLDLLKYLVLTYSNEGDTILDNTCGSGTTLRACKDLGRKFIGIEIEKKYCDMAVKRLAQEVLF